MILFPAEYGEETPFTSVFIFVVVVGIFSLLARFNLSWVDRVPAITLIDRWSFGLYIFHNWMALYLISNSAKRLLHLEDLALSHPYIYPFCFFLATLAISSFLTYLLLKTRIGRYLIG